MKTKIARVENQGKPMKNHAKLKTNQENLRSPGTLGPDSPTLSVCSDCTMAIVVAINRGVLRTHWICLLGLVHECQGVCPEPVHSRHPLNLRRLQQIVKTHKKNIKTTNMFKTRSLKHEHERSSAERQPEL